MPYEFKAVRRVEFSETDMAGIVHFSNFFRMMEATEHAFFRSLGFTIQGHENGAASIRSRADARLVDRGLRSQPAQGGEEILGRISFADPR